MVNPKVSFSDIICDQQIMPRDHISQDYVDELSEDLESGAVFPPVDLSYDGKQYYVADGYHRIEAVKKSGKEKIDATVHNGDKRAAMLFAGRANACHGRRRTNKDKRKVVNNFLNDPKWCKWSDGKIAQHCIVTQQFVSKLRRELTQNRCESSSKRLGADGREINTNNIGKKQPLNKNPSSDNQNHKNGKSTDTDHRLTTSTLSVADLNPNPKDNDKPNKSSKQRDNKNAKNRDNTNGGDKSLWTKEQTKKIVNQVSDIIAKFSGIKNLLESKSTKTKSKVKTFRKLREEIIKLWIELYEDFDNLAE